MVVYLRRRRCCRLWGLGLVYYYYSAGWYCTSDGAGVVGYGGACLLRLVVVSSLHVDAVDAPGAGLRLGVVEQVGVDVERQCREPTVTRQRVETSH